MIAARGGTGMTLTSGPATTNLPDHSDQPPERSTRFAGAQAMISVTTRPYTSVSR